MGGRMNLGRVTILLAALLLTAAEARGTTVDLRRAETIALAENLDLRAAEAGVRAAGARLKGAYGLYDPQLSAALGLGKQRDRLNFQFFNAKEVTDSRQVDVALSQQLPTGGVLELASRNLRFDTDPPPAVNPYYDGEIRFSLVQPLLRDAGRGVTEEEIRLAAKDRESSVIDLRQQAFEVIAGVRNAYFEVLSLRDLARSRRTSVSLAEEVLAENRRRVEVGVLPPVEILEAEVGLKLRQRELLDAERLERDAADRLAVLLSMPEPVTVAEQPMGLPELEVDAGEGFRLALMLRPDLQLRLRELERLEIEREVAANAMLPALDLTAAYAHRSLAGDLDDYTGELADDELANWEVGVQLSYPLGNRRARNDYRRLGWEQQALRSRISRLHEEVRREIRAAIRRLEVSRTKVEVSRSARELAEEQLRILLRRQEVGLATTRDILEGEEDLAQARTDLIAALAEYNQAVTAYLQATGQLLLHEGIRIVARDPEEPPDLRLD